MLDSGVPPALRGSCAGALGRIGNYGPLDALATVAHADPGGYLGDCAAAAIEDILRGEQYRRGTMHAKPTHAARSDRAKETA